MARELRVLSAGVERPDERSVFPPEARTGPFVAVRVVSDDLKAKPVHALKLTEDEALRLAEQLLTAVRIVRQRPTT